MPFTLPSLPYEYGALDPYIDARTMEIHYTKHHQAYIDKLNAALEKYPDWAAKDIDDILRNLDSVPDDISTPVRNHGGGYANHNLFWTIMSPDGGGEPSGELGKAITTAFGSFKDFKQQFADAAVSRFGSGWAWLVRKDDGSLAIGSTANQDTPLMGESITGFAGAPLLGLDVWEHAYYLKYQNKRPDYIDAWWNVVNWEQVSQNLAAAV